MKIGELHYHKDIDRWVFEDQTDGYHCGAVLEFKIGNRYVYGRLECGKEWYVIFPDARFRLMKDWVYPVRVQ